MVEDIHVNGYNRPYKCNNHSRAEILKYWMGKPHMPTNSQAVCYDDANMNRIYYRHCDCLTIKLYWQLFLFDEIYISIFISFLIVLVLHSFGWLVGWLAV